jgi:hypothetical protein
MHFQLPNFPCGFEIPDSFAGAAPSKGSSDGSFKGFGVQF